MYWNELTTAQIATLSKELPVVIPLGSCEQHGRHLPVFVDTLQLEEIVSRVNQVLSDRIVVAPVLWLGSSNHHRDFPGALSVSPSLFGQMVTALAQCVLGAGFRRIFFLNGHGGNLVPASSALCELTHSDDRADAATIALASWWSLASSRIQPQMHGMVTPKLTHACEYETSLILAIREDLVKLASLNPAHHEERRIWAEDPRWGGKVEEFHRFHRWTTSGHMGNPAAATREKGFSLLTAISEALVEFLNDFSTWPKMPVIGDYGVQGQPPSEGNPENS